jgi:hypothetical protein
VGSASVSHGVSLHSLSATRIVTVSSETLGLEAKALSLGAADPDDDTM